MHVAHDAQISNTEDWGFRVFVDRNDRLGALHADQMLGRTGDTGRDVYVWLYDLAGLTDLVAVRNPAGVNNCTACPRCCLECQRKALDQCVAVGFAEAASTGDNNSCLVELGAFGLFDE